MRKSKLIVCLHLEIYKENCKRLGESLNKSRSDFYLKKSSSFNGDQVTLYHIVDSLLVGANTADKCIDTREAKLTIEIIRLLLGMYYEG